MIPIINLTKKSYNACVPTIILLTMVKNVKHVILQSIGIKILWNVRAAKVTSSLTRVYPNVKDAHKNTLFSQELNVQRVQLALNSSSKKINVSPLINSVP